MRITCDDGAQRHRLQLHDRHRRLVGGRAAARPSRPAADRPRPGADRSDLEGPVLRTRTPPRSARSRAWRSRRSTRRCGTGAAGATAQPLWKCRRRRASNAFRCTRPKAAGCTMSRRRSGATRRVAAQGSRASRAPRSRSASRTSAEDVARLARGARGGRRRVRDHGRCQPGFTRRRGAAPRARRTPSSARLVRGAAAGRRPRRPRRAGRGERRCRSRSANRSTIRPFREYLERGACSIVQVDVRAHRRHHAVAQGGAPGRGVQRRRCARIS